LPDAEIGRIGSKVTPAKKEEGNPLLLHGQSHFPSENKEG